MALDPRTSDEAAREWTKQLLQWLAWAEHETQLWYEALVEQISMGLISCKEVQFYNQQAERLYYWEAWVWDKFDPLWAVMRGKGLSIPDDPPFPKLIGTTYQVYGGKRQLAKFKATIPCPVSGMLDTQNVNVYGLPTACYVQDAVDAGNQPQSPVWTGAMLDFGGGGELGATVAEVVIGVVLIAGVAYLVHEFTGAARSIAGTIDGSTIANINAQMYNRQLEVDRRRAEYITACQRDMIARLGKLGTALTVEQQVEIRKQCENGAQVAYPDRRPPYASRGIVGVILVLGVVGGAAGIVYLVTRRPERGRAAAA